MHRVGDCVLCFTEGDLRMQLTVRSVANFEATTVRLN